MIDCSRRTESTSRPSCPGLVRMEGADLGLVTIFSSAGTKGWLILSVIPERYSANLAGS